MALVIDERLLEAEGEMNITENFNRLAAMVDAAEEHIHAVEFPYGLVIDATNATVRVYNPATGQDFEPGDHVFNAKSAFTLYYEPDEGYVIESAKVNGVNAGDVGNEFVVSDFDLSTLVDLVITVKAVAEGGES